MLAAAVENLIVMVEWYSLDVSRGMAESTKLARARTLAPHSTHWLVAVAPRRRVARRALGRHALRLQYPPVGQFRQLRLVGQ